MGKMIEKSAAKIFVKCSFDKIKQIILHFFKVVIVFGQFFICRIKKTAITNVRISAAGNDHKRPSNPKKIGRITGSDTPKMISRVMETAVEANALPSACK